MTMSRVLACAPSPPPPKTHPFPPLPSPTQLKYPTKNGALQTHGGACAELTVTCTQSAIGSGRCPCISTHTHSINTICGAHVRWVRTNCTGPRAKQQQLRHSNACTNAMATTRRPGLRARTHLEVDHGRDTGDVEVASQRYLGPVRVNHRVHRIHQPKVEQVIGLGGNLHQGGGGWTPHQSVPHHHAALTSIGVAA
jgi:hypothetical protein